ncbi:MAG: hypothetical protein RMJ66_08385, partial [Bacteroidia bacterium]|nr:hypothetical protein [Bacteroidia bacterium]MDW8135065.1 hypothetical protein [Bacteroidia bacterium]
YTQLREKGKWTLRGEGLLWDSSWIKQNIEAISTASPSLWRTWQEIKSSGLCDKIWAFYTVKGGTHIWLRTREPIARVVLPIRQYYVDKEGNRLPVTRPLDMPVIQMHRWDSLAVGLFSSWWQKYPWYHRAVSYLQQLPDGVWQGYLEISPEQFVLGRTVHLPTALEQWEVYLRLIQPKEGGNACEKVILYIPGQIICQRNQSI